MQIETVPIVVTSTCVALIAPETQAPTQKSSGAELVQLWQEVEEMLAAERAATPPAHESQPRQIHVRYAYD